MDGALICAVDIAILPRTYITFIQKNPAFKGQWGVPLTVYPWYLLCSLGILGDNLPINTH